MLVMGNVNMWMFIVGELCVYVGRKLIYLVWSEIVEVVYFVVVFVFDGNMGVIIVFRMGVNDDVI